MFLGFGRGVFGGVFPVGNLPGILWALGVYGGGFPLIYTGRLTNLGDTRNCPFSPFVVLEIVRVIGGLLLLLVVWRLLF